MKRFEKMLNTLKTLTVLGLFAAGGMMEPVGAQENQAATPVANRSAASTATAAVGTPTPAQDLSMASLEQLMGLNVVVTSSSKKAESLRDATSAIFVITQDDIRRSGAQTVPDLLAMVPGVQVARQSADVWAISARGFNANYNDKMLVLVDGRSVYDPVLGGVNWNQQDIMLEDIDHIEVIRGPGGTLWGSNAVNGVVNIITKDTKVTQGLFLSTGIGLPLYPAGVSGQTALNGTGAFRYGGKFSEDAFYRIFGQVNNVNPSQNAVTGEGESALGGAWNDAWYDFRAGFRSDIHADADQFTFEGEAQKGYTNYAQLSTASDPFFNPSNFMSFTDINTNIDQHAYLLARWTRDFQDDSEIQALAYYDYDNLTTANDDRISNLGQANVEFQHRFHLAGINEITWGGSWRNYTDQFFNQIAWQYAPQSQNIYSGFLQDKLTLVEGRLYVTGGVKAENNPYTGTEWQPSGRVLFLPDDNSSFWGAVSRAVRIPTQLAEDGYLYLYGVPPGTFGPGTPAYYEGLVPNPSLQSETLVSYELGFRTNVTKEISLDIASFYNHYENLISIPSVNQVFTSPLGVFDPSTGLTPYQETNSGEGDIYGVETSVKWEPASNFHASVAYTYQGYDQAMINASNVDLGAPPPHNLVNCRLTYEWVKGLELNNNVTFTDTTYLYDANSGNSITPSYFRWDLGANFKANDSLEVALWGLDLEGAHTETLQSYGVSPTEIVPAVAGKVTVRY